METLYSLSQEYLDVDSYIDDLESATEGGLNGTMISSMASKLDTIKDEGNYKAASIVKWIRNLETSIEARKSEILRLKNKNTSDENRIEALRAYLLTWLQLSKQQKVKTDLGTISRRKPAMRLIVDTDKILEWNPQAYEYASQKGIIKEVIEVNKQALKNMPDYLSLPGVREEEGNETIAIR